MDDSLTRTRPTSPSELIRNLRENPAGRSNPQAAEAPLPATPPDAVEFGPEVYDPDRKDYKAFGWAGNRTVASIRFIHKDQSEIGCSFAHLDTHYPGGCEFIPSAPRRGNLIRLRFAGASVTFMLEIEGRNLRRCWELIMGQQTPWVAEYPADMDTEGVAVTVIKAIRYEPVK